MFKESHVKVSGLRVAGDRSGSIPASKLVEDCELKGAAVFEVEAQDSIAASLANEEEVLVF